MDLFNWMQKFFGNSGRRKRGRWLPREFLNMPLFDKRPTTNPEAQDLARASHKFRNRVLTTPASQVGISASADFPRVYGILMDWHVYGSISTVAVLHDGSCSLHSAAGFKKIAGGPQAITREAAERLMRAAEQNHDDAVQARNFPYPKENQVFFYLLTFGGVRLLKADKASISPNRGKYWDLYTRAKTIVDDLREQTNENPEE